MEVLLNLQNKNVTLNAVHVAPKVQTVATV